MFNLQPELTSARLTLRPLTASDFAELYQAASDPLIWEQHPFPRHEKATFKMFFEQALSEGALVIRDRATQKIIGTSRFYKPLPDEIRVGYTFLARAYWGGSYNRELKALMVGYALQHVTRVFFDIGETNHRSRKAMEKLGGRFVGNQILNNVPYTVYVMDKTTFDLPSFKKGSALTEEDIAQCRKIIGASQPFGIYLNAALAGRARGQDNRLFHIAKGEGLVMVIEFDELRIFTTVGQISHGIVSEMAASRRRAEFHVPKPIAQTLKRLAGPRVVREWTLRYYQMNRDKAYDGQDINIKRLAPVDIDLVAAFYARHYDQRIFSEWMLAQPFFGLFVDGKLAATGGTVVVDEIGHAANIGNFLTAPEHRGKGYAKLVARRLINELIVEGIKTFTLGTADENLPAWKAYESIAFRLTERRSELELAPP